MTAPVLLVVPLAEPAARERADGARPGHGGRGVRGPVPGRPRRHRRRAGDRPGRAAPVGAVRVRGHRRAPAAADPGRADARRPARRHQPGDAAAHHPGHDRPAPAAPAARPPAARSRTASRRSTRATRRRRTPSSATTTTARSRSTRSSSTPTPPTPRRPPGWPWPSCCSAPRTSTSTPPARPPPRAPTTSPPRPWSPTSTCSAATSTTPSTGWSTLVRRTAGRRAQPGPRAPARPVRRGRQRRPAGAQGPAGARLRAVLTRPGSAAMGTHSTGRLARCSSLCGVEPSIAPRIGLSPAVPTTITVASSCVADLDQRVGGLGVDELARARSTPAASALSSACAVAVRPISISASRCDLNSSPTPPGGAAP